MSADAVHNENAWNFGLQQQCDGMMRTHHQVCFVRNFCASQHCLRLLKRELEVPSWAGTKSRNTSTLPPLAVITRATKDRCFAILRSVGSATRENFCLCKSSQISWWLLSKSILYDGSALCLAATYILRNFRIIMATLFNSFHTRRKSALFCGFQ